MKRRHALVPWLWSLLVACGAGGGAGAVEDTTSSGGSSGTPVASTGEPECHAGYERCPCMDGRCLDGLVCLSDLCVQPDLEVTGSTGGAEGSTSTADGTAASSGSGSGSATSSSSSEGSSTTAVVPECLDDDNYCADETLQTCVDGSWELTSCSDRCAESGYLSPGCASPDACLCDGYADETCNQGAFNICVCAEIDYDIPCDAAQQKEFYDQCWNMDNAWVECFAAVVVDDYTDCAPLEAACL